VVYLVSLNRLGKYVAVPLVNIKKGNSITKENIVNGNIPVIAGGQTSPYNHNIANYQSDAFTSLFCLF
jgi:predicted ThiF/HesA family dinucleotide-utilizing enzyme